MKRRKIAIAAGVCFSFFLGTLLNLLFVPGFDYHHQQRQQRLQGNQQPGLQGNQQPGLQGNQQPGLQGNQQPGLQGNQQPGLQGNQQPGLQGNQQPGLQGNQQPGLQGNQQQQQNQQPGLQPQQPGLQPQQPGLQPQQPGLQPQQPGLQPQQPGLQPQQPGLQGNQQPGLQGNQQPGLQGNQQPQQQQQQNQQTQEQQDHRGDQESVEPQRLQTGAPWLAFHQPTTNPDLLRQIRERHREVIHYRDLLVTWPAAGRLSRPPERRLMDLEPHKSSGRPQAPPASQREPQQRPQQRQQDRDSPSSPGSQKHKPLGDPDGARLLPRPPLSCPAIHNASSVHYLGSGYTKAVYRAALNRTLSVALKSVDLAGHDMENCVQRYRAREACYRLARYKLLKEMTLLQRLQHSNILKLYGYCYQDSNDISDTLTTITELGTPLEMIQLLQTSWEERFRICLSLIHLLHYLAHSPLGSVTLLDFRPRQFVIVDGELKVTDLDDASAVETPCSSPADCFLEFPARNFTLACSAEWRCHNMNEKRNLYNAYRFFFTYLLPHSAPPSLRSLLDTVVNATGELHWGIDETLAQLEKVLYLFKSGLYLQNVTRGSVSEYKQLHDVSVREENYRCWPSYHHDGCLLSVYDLNEAMEICDSHSQCRAFVLTNQTTWTGRQLAFFKASSNHIVPDEGKITYVRMTD